MLRRRSVRLRIIVLVLVPVIALVSLYGLLLSLSLNSLISLREAETVRGEVTTPVTNIQLEVSRERMYALEYLARPNHYRLSLLLTAESKSDYAISRYDSITAAALSKGVQSERIAIRTWSAQLATLRQLRAAVVSVGLSRAAAAQAYSQIVIGGNSVINQALLPLLATPGIIQANDLLVLEQSLQAEGEESNLFLADLTTHSYPGADQRLLSQLIVQHRELWAQAMAGLAPANQKIFAKDIPAAAAAKLTAMENKIAAGRKTALRISATTWNSATHAYNMGFIKALHAAANAVRGAAVSQARGLVLRLLLIAMLGLLAIIAAITVAVIVSRNLLRELSDLRTSAIALSSQRLPAVLGRLRAGAEVDIDSETPQLEIEDNEIGELRRAINYTARAAIGAAVDEVAIRRGVNDMFRNLARRNQSLLTRQLELLDSMERRIHDPEELADLFRVDHLTTRMRRHAEGLLIVAGGSSGRVWREPVPVIDVMRAAVAEVEDYTRIRVTSRSNASVAGHAVADIIHMLAELVENATTFSPANTPVRIESDNVAKGLVVEIEDRGLGMSDEQVAQINVRLADPPLFDLSGSEQLGLYIAGQLAGRHGVKITMRGSAYGGVIAVVLIPSALIVDAGYDEPPTVVGIRELGGRPVPQLPGPAGRYNGGRTETDLPAAVAASAGSGEDGALSADYAGSTGYLVNLEAAATAITSHSQPGTGPLEPLSPEPVPPLLNLSEQPKSNTDVDEEPLPAGEADLPGLSSFDTSSPSGALGGSSGWLNLPGSEADLPVAGSLDEFGDLPHRESTLPRRDAWSPEDFTEVEDDASELPRRQPLLPEPLSEPEPDAITLTGMEGLPVRVRQANLAPQLRDEAREKTGTSPSPAYAQQYVPAPEMVLDQAHPAQPDAEATDASPEAARSFMSALQRGWERGRSMVEQLNDDADGDQS
ncbi:MAG TPA: ATP-binding protein [Streptosporangiaceae bacterium]|nr:ATP-binding protein [Streptosporangiaceae bacterium]